MNLYSICKYIFGLISYIFSEICSKIKSTRKWFLRRTTGLCELQRVIYGSVMGYERAVAIENCLAESKITLIRRLYQQFNDFTGSAKFHHYETREAKLNDVSKMICNAKSINIGNHRRFFPGLKKCLLTIAVYDQLRSAVEELRQQQFILGKTEDEEKLRIIWRNLIEEEVEIEEEREWDRIGFQGSHPSTDFRGTGMLGAYSLMYFAMHYKWAARKLLDRYNHSENGYPLACSSISMCHLASTLLKNGNAKSHFFNSYQKFQVWHDQQASTRPTLSSIKTSTNRLLEMFFEFYVAIFLKFDEFWVKSGARSRMEFEVKKKEFEKLVKQELEIGNCKFSPPSVDV